LLELPLAERPHLYKFQRLIATYTSIHLVVLISYLSD
jgi:hypothetical protein